MNDYGTGGNWFFIYAQNAEQIKQRYPELEVKEEWPSWLRGEILKNTEEKLTYDIDAPPTGILAAIIEERNQGD